jgi:integrase/recombinase XerD
MMPTFAALAEEYVALRRGLGYQLRRQETHLRGFASFLDRLGHHGPVPSALSTRWAGETNSTDPCHPARRLAALRGFLRYIAAFDGATEIPAPGVLGRKTRRKPPHVYSDDEIERLLRAAADLPPRDGSRSYCYRTLFALLACTGLRISEALALARDDVDLVDGILTVRAGKGGRTRLVPLHPSALAPLRRYADRRDGQQGARPSGTFFRTEAADRLTYGAVCSTFRGLRRQLGWTAEGRARMPRIHDLRHRLVVRRILLWHTQGVDVDRKIASLATYLGHVVVSDIYWYFSAVPELMAVVARRFGSLGQRQREGGRP